MLVTVSLPSGRSVDVTCSPEGLVRDLEVMVQKELGPLTLAKGDGQILDPTWSLKDAKVEDWGKTIRGTSIRIQTSEKVSGFGTSLNNTLVFL